MTRRLPTAKEINPFDTLDGRSAEQHFLGKTAEEAEALFRDNCLYYGGDLMHMGPIAFCFYLPAAMAYLKSSSAEKDTSFIDTVCGVMEIRLEWERQEIVDAYDSMIELCSYILSNFARFEVSTTIYRDLQDRYRKLMEQLSIISSLSPE